MVYLKISAIDPDKISPRVFKRMLTKFLTNFRNTKGEIQIYWREDKTDAIVAVNKSSSGDFMTAFMGRVWKYFDVYNLKDFAD